MKFFLLFTILLFTADAAMSQAKLKFKFINTASGKPLTLRDSNYINPHGEEYNLKKLRYYIGNPAAGAYNYSGNYFLIDEARNTSFEVDVKPGTYNSISFLLGVDSIYNCSGAQEGALDPMNDMFWTWNTGYVMFKLEGTSPASKGDLNRIEHHIGGYRFEQNVATQVVLPVQEFSVKAGETVEVSINMELDRYWKGVNDVKISDAALCMSPGPLAVSISKNFRGLFQVTSVSNN